MEYNLKIDSLEVDRIVRKLVLHGEYILATLLLRKTGRTFSEAVKYYKSLTEYKVSRES